MKKALPWWLLFGVFMSLMPVLISTGSLRIFIFANFIAIFAMSWDILSGYTGYISFGHPFLIGIAGYTSAILSHQYAMPLYASMPLAILLTLVAGSLFFFPALRTRGTYFALVTLAFMEVTYHLVQVVKPQITGGSRGLTGLPLLVTGAIPNYYVSLFAMLLIGFGLWALTKSGLGTVFSAIRMDEDAVKSAGLNTSKFKFFAFMLSALVAGIGGVLYTHYLGSISPRGMFDINFLFTILIAALIGGEHTILGPILGAYFLTFLLEFLRPYIPGAWRYLCYGMVALIVYSYAPKGLFTIVDAVNNRIKGKRIKGKEYDSQTA
ncbi:MAG: branched-chain amino acid ABC transporter permease [bacterium]|nr:branched-chain amino acid ABC transporter permease [bacterium]